ncbi:MAG: prenyltransferase/squalene oxidase repeat-containing protein [Chloroflexota bacterium]
MVKSNYPIYEQLTLGTEILGLLNRLGEGKTSSVAYDTAWVGRLSRYYPGRGFEKSLEWLRRHQNDDGTWGAPLLHFHDRFASTLAAIVALREAGSASRDDRRVKRGEASLWKLVSRLGRDDSDTVGFPIVSASLAEDAAGLGFDVPRPPLRYAAAYKRKVESLLAQPKRDWTVNALSFSLEGLWRAVGDDDHALEGDLSVASSPAATAAYLFRHPHEGALEALRNLMQPDGGIPAFAKIDIFEIAWALYQLQTVKAIQPDMPEVRKFLDRLWELWSPETGMYYSSYFRVPDLDLTSTSFILLRWGGYPVEADVFQHFEMDDHFCTYRQETNPSPSAHLRFLLALQSCPEHEQQPAWRQKAVSALRVYDENGSYWWDKWHASPYYVSNLAIHALHRLDPELATSRLKWILKTQNDDGGWGYLDQSTSEETAYCLDALLLWDRMVETVDPVIITQAAEFLSSHSQDRDYTPLWISKGLFTPYNIVQATIWSAQFQYMEW